MSFISQIDEFNYLTSLIAEAETKRRALAPFIVKGAASPDVPVDVDAIIAAHGSDVTVDALPGVADAVLTDESLAGFEAEHKQAIDTRAEEIRATVALATQILLTAAKAGAGA